MQIGSISRIPVPQSASVNASSTNQSQRFSTASNSSQLSTSSARSANGEVDVRQLSQLLDLMVTDLQQTTEQADAARLELSSAADRLEQADFTKQQAAALFTELGDAYLELREQLIGEDGDESELGDADLARLSAVLNELGTASAAYDLAKDAFNEASAWMDSISDNSTTLDAEVERLTAEVTNGMDELMATLLMGIMAKIVYDMTVNNMRTMNSLKFDIEE